MLGPQRGVLLLRHQKGLLPLVYQASNYSDARVYNLASLKRGTGGRSSFNGIVATVFGASGFVGPYVCNRLGKTGTQLIVAYRGDPYDVRPLKVCGDLGQVLFTPYHLQDEESIEKAMRHSNVVINLVGRDWETKNFKFDDVHVEGAARLARIAKRVGVKKFVHLSALNACLDPTPTVLPGGSQFLISKCRGEAAVREEFPEAIIFRPSDIYGQEDRFLRFYVHVWRRQMGVLPMYKKGEETIKQPVFINDVAAGIIKAIQDPDAVGKVYQAVGPKRYVLADLVDWFLRIIKRDETCRRVDLRYAPFFKLRVSVTGKICPGFPVGNLHWERIERENVTDKVDRRVPTLEDLGVCLTPMEDQIDWELRPYRHGIYYDRDLAEFGQRPDPPKPVTC